MWQESDQRVWRTAFLLCTVVLSFLFIPFSTLSAASFTVSTPAEFRNALNAAGANGEDDKIEVQAGVYHIDSTLRFWSEEGHSLLIRGKGGPVLDGGNAVQIMELITTSNRDHLYVVGLVFQHGRADYGGGLYLETADANITLDSCVVQDNTAGFVCGGVNIYSITGNIAVSNCTFKRNSSPNTSGYPYGTAGGLFVQTEGEGPQITVTDCTFEDNRAQRDGAGAMLYPVGPHSTVIVERSVFNNNTAQEFGGGCWIRCPADSATVEYRSNTIAGNAAATAGGGGGTYIEIASGRIDLTDNVHTANHAAWQGGGLWLEHGGGDLTIRNNSWAENEAEQNGGGANIYLENGTAAIDRNVFHANRSSQSGGGLCLSTTSAALQVFNNTFAANTASDGGDVYLYFDSSSSRCDFYNNILYADALPALAFSGAVAVTARYSDIKGGSGEPWFGAGCIDADPMFVDAAGGDFHLAWANFPADDATKSPCIDAGDPASPPDADETIADMGAFYFNQKPSTRVEESDVMSKADFMLQQNLPNPFNASTIIQYTLRKPAQVTLRIYNLNGQLVETLVREEQPAGRYRVVWDARRVDSGVYFCRLNSGDEWDVKRLLLLK